MIAYMSWLGLLLTRYIRIVGGTKMNLTFLAFGAGQCSSAILFLGIKFDKIIFCDTGFELPLTYAWIDIVEQAYPKKFVRLKTTLGPKNLCQRPICTKYSKVEPTARYLRSIGVTKATRILGYTIDEKRRMKQYEKWITSSFPLIDLGFSRKDCQKLLLDKVGFVPPRSGCTICKYFDRQHLIPGYGFGTHDQSLYPYLYKDEGGEKMKCRYCGLKLETEKEKNKHEDHCEIQMLSQDCFE